VIFLSVKDDISNTTHGFSFVSYPEDGKITVLGD
jgi:hypothetical protein